MRAVIYLRVSTKEQVEKDLTEEGFSIAAQREACVRLLAERGWELVDEYADKGESARTADRPQLRAMLARVAEDGDVEAVVVHKVDRLARNIEDHVAIRALLRRRGVTLVSVAENLDETASGRLVEGIHALMAEFYSANLANEVRKGMSQKAKSGGYPHKAPLGYLNLREPIGGRQVAHIVADPERAPLVRRAFELYATGEWTVERLAHEMATSASRTAVAPTTPPRRSRSPASRRCWPTPPTPASSHGREPLTPDSTSRSSTAPPSARCRSCLPPAPRAAHASAAITTT
jgi:site-specific DNA recombinase